MIRFKTMRLMAAAAMVAIAFASCSKDDNPEPDGPAAPEIVLTSNSFQYGDKSTPVALNSAVYEMENGKYTFYFSNQSGIRRVSEMKALPKEDYMVVSGVTPDAQNAQTAYTVTQGDMTVTERPVFDNQTVTVAHDFGEAGEHILMKIRFQNNDTASAGGNFYALYDGACAESDYPVVANGYAVGKAEPKAIVSVTEERNIPEGTYTYYIYDTEAENAEPVITFTIEADKLGASYNADDSFEGSVVFAGKELTGGSDAFGGVSVANYSDPALKGVARTISLTYRSEASKDEYYRLNYTGSVYAVYASSDQAQFGDSEDAAKMLFTYADEKTQRTYFVYGNTESDDIHDICRNGEEGAWCVMFSVMTRDLTGGGKFAVTTDGFGLEATAYQYDKYEIVSCDASSTVTIYPNPNGEGSELYFYFDGKFGDMPFKFEYKGLPVAAELEKDETLTGVLAPDNPTEAMLRVYDTRTTGDMGWENNEFTPFAESVKEIEIGELYVEKVDNKIIEGGRINGNSYAFYMALIRVPSVPSYRGSLGDRAYTPMLVIPEAALGQKLDLTVPAANDSSYWLFEFAGKYDFSEMNDKWCSGGNTQALPSKGSVLVTQNEDKTFNISLYIYDYREGLQSPGGRKTLALTVKNFRGQLYPSENNMLTEEDLQ